MGLGLGLGLGLPLGSVPGGHPAHGSKETKTSAPSGFSSTSASRKGISECKEDKTLHTVRGRPLTLAPRTLLLKTVEVEEEEGAKDAKETKKAKQAKIDEGLQRSLCSYGALGSLFIQLAKIEHRLAVGASEKIQTSAFFCAIYPLIQR